MAIEALFWDVGGVLLSNGWDRVARERAAARFGLDAVELADRHEMMVHDLETGQISFDAYLKAIVFYRERSFTHEAFFDFVRHQSQAIPEVLALARAVGATGRWLMCTINNESRELNEYRIRQFDLRSLFPFFVSSCYVGVRKPEERIYRLALELTQREAPNCVMIDDRALNLEHAKRLGLHTVQCENAEQVRRALEELGVSA